MEQRGIKRSGCAFIKWQKQQPRGVLKKRCSKNMHQIYRRTPLSKSDFIKVAKINKFLNIHYAVMQHFICKITKFTFKTSDIQHSTTKVVHQKNKPCKLSVGTLFSKANSLKATCTVQLKSLATFSTQHCQHRSNHIEIK